MRLDEPELIDTIGACLFNVGLGHYTAAGLREAAGVELELRRGATNTFRAQHDVAQGCER